MSKTKKIISISAGSAILASVMLATPSFAAEADTDPYKAWAKNSHASTTAYYGDNAIKDIEIHNGEIYSAYGNYGTNIGPIQISSHNLQTAEQTDHLLFQGEETNTFRKVNGELVTPNIDPKAPWTSNVGYASSNGGQWKDIEATPFIHVFDVGSTGDDIWLSGSISNPDQAKYGPNPHLAAVKRSTDGGATWTIEKVRSSNGSSDFDRNYWLAPVNGKMYTKAQTNTTATTLDVWENGVWTEEKIPYNLNITVGSKVQVLGSNIIFLNGGVIHTYNTSTKILTNTAVKAKDTYVEENSGKIFAYSKSGHIIKSGNLVLVPERILSSTDGLTWNTERELNFDNIPPTTVTTEWGSSYVTYAPESIAVDGDNVYFGMNTGEIFKNTLKAPPLAVDIKVPSETMTLTEYAKPLENVTAKANNGIDLTSTIKATKKVDWKGMTVTYKVTYLNVTKTVERKVIY